MRRTILAFLVTASLIVGVSTFFAGPAALAGARTTVMQPVSTTFPSPADPLSVRSVAAFDEFGGEAVFEPGTTREETFTYDGVDTTSNEVFGVRRGDHATAHPVGAVVEALGPKSGPRPHPASDPPSQPPHDLAPDDGDGTSVIEDGTSDVGGESIAAPSSTWMTNHCVATDSNNSLHPVYVYDGVDDPGTSADNTRVSSPLSKIREEIQAADRAIAQSHEKFKQHMRIACAKDVSGAWTNIAVASYAVPTTADSNIDGYISCDETWSHMRNTSVYGRNAATKTDRHYWYLDSSLAGTGCSAGLSDARGINTPGTANPNNTSYGDARSDYAEWSASGVSNRSVMVTLQEFHHSLGIVGDGSVSGSTKTPSNCCGAHSRDEVDFMNGGYCRSSKTPNCTDGQSILTTCSKPSALTYKDTYADCGRQDYWAPNAGTSNFLCTHYNLAWDSLFYHQRETPTTGCR